MSLYLKISISITYLILIFYIFSNLPTINSQKLNDDTLYQITKEDTQSDSNYHIEVRENPTWVALNDNLLYVVNRNSSSISVISTENNTKIGEDIPVGRIPNKIAFDPVENKAFVLNGVSNTVSVISTENNTKIGEDIPVGIGPISIAVDFGLIPGDDFEIISMSDFYDKAYVANYRSNTVSVISTENNTKIGEDIPVGIGPISIAVDDFHNKTYVANYGSNTVSVISTENNTKIGEDIPVGIGPTSIAINIFNNKTYVANYGSNSVSVISTEKDEKIADIIVEEHPQELVINGFENKSYVANFDSNSVSAINTTSDTRIGNIPVGIGPTSIALNIFKNKAYVANYDSNSVSVISTENNTKIGEDIPVGIGPTSMVVDKFKGVLYVSNSQSDSISVIDQESGKVVGGFFFNVKPSNSGYIECAGIASPLQKIFYIFTNAQCKAIPNKGFEFLSWEENLNGNSTRLIHIAQSSFDNIFDYFSGISDSITNFLGFQGHLNYLIDSLESNLQIPVKTNLDGFSNYFGIKADFNQGILNTTKFGSFTANFKELPPPIPTEYLTTLFGFALTTGLGVWLIPWFVRWTRTKTEIRKSNYYHQRIKKLYADNNLNNNGMGELDALNNEIFDTYSIGKMKEIQYNTLKTEISIIYKDLFTKRIESFNLDNKGSLEKLQEMSKSIEDSYSERKMNDTNYVYVNKEISKVYDKIFRKSLDALLNSTDNDTGEQLSKLKNDIEITHSEQKITETQFNLLNKKISNLEDKFNHEART